MCMFLRPAQVCVEQQRLRQVCHTINQCSVFVHHSTANHAVNCVHPIAICIYCKLKFIHVLLHWLLILITWLFITLDMLCSLSLDALSLAYTTSLTAWDIDYIMVLGDRNWHCSIWNSHTAMPHMRAFPSPSPQLSSLAVMINAEKQHTKLSGSLLFFSALLFVLQATITVVEDWVRGYLGTI